MIRLSGQQGVPVIIVDDGVVIGFDRQRLEELLAAGVREKVELGASVGDAMPRTQVEGAYVGRVKRGSLAEKAGLKARDVIVELDGQPVCTAADLARILTTLHVGTRSRLIYVRDGQRVPAELPIV